MKIEIIDGFEDAAVESVYISVWGPTGVGKTRLASTLPWPIGILPLDRNSKTTLKNFWGLADNRRGMFLTPKLPRGYDVLAAQLPDEETAQDAMSDEQIRAAYLPHVQQTMRLARAMAKTDARSILLDGQPRFYEDVCRALYGKKPKFGSSALDVDPIHSTMREMLDYFNGRNVLITSWDKAEFSGPIPTGRRIAEGWKRIGGNSAIEIELKRPKVQTDITILESQWKCDIEPDDFVCLIWKATNDPYIHYSERGVLLNNEITIPHILQRVYPEKDLEKDWGYSEEQLDWVFSLK